MAALVCQSVFSQDFIYGVNFSATGAGNSLLMSLLYSVLITCLHILQEIGCSSDYAREGRKEKRIREDTLLIFLASLCCVYVRNACAIYLCSLLGEACESVSDASKCIYNLRFRWWCRRVCKYVTGICYQGNRHSVNRCNGMAGAVLLARSSFHSDSTSQLPMQEFLCVCVCGCVCVCEYGVN